MRILFSVPVRVMGQWGDSLSRGGDVQRAQTEHDAVEHGVERDGEVERAEARRTRRVVVSKRVCHCGAGVSTLTLRRRQTAVLLRPWSS